MGRALSGGVRAIRQVATAGAGVLRPQQKATTAARSFRGTRRFLFRFALRLLTAADKCDGV
jgi:hypothetical protein